MTIEQQDYRQFAQHVLPHLNQYLDERLDKDIVGPNLRDAMKYSVDAGGKRLRPLLVLATMGTFSDAPLAQGFGAAGAIELVHTYSLIHDDLPAMDNSDLRRGEPTNHKVFGEAHAILAGDGLLTLAFQWLAENTDLTAEQRIQQVGILSRAAGPANMVAGQVEDIEGEQKKLDLDHLTTLHRHKTGAMIEAAVWMGTVMTDLTKAQQDVLKRYASDFGLAFQIQDDLMDVLGTEAETGKPVGNDTEAHKNTFPSLIGIDASIERINQLVADANDALAAVQSLGDVTLLQSFLDYFDTDHLETLKEQRQ
ncbi:ispA protein [Lactobacillus selangorensis]|uniref:Farnesyl diphosphate synthase n=1 Tax=Lactobacillus selangorensis TaxID=81857 RepID=A0A0R2GAJ2_9LACO|nr:farnesyl diphosphate synthase [Lactobacillus selangorensis]KRN29659.1 ispA protein [Lactobacillus selangorensis]KRN33812.1 ispA protein [Lactobacillus selangorensis]